MKIIQVGFLRFWFIFFEELCLPNLPSRPARSAHAPEWGLAVTISSFKPFLMWDYLAVCGLWTVTSCILQIFWTDQSSFWQVWAFYPYSNLKLAPPDRAGLGSGYFFRLCSPAFLKAVNLQNLLSIRIFQWGICTHFQTNKLQSSPPALITCRSPLVNRMFVTWGEWPKNLLCFA